ncbi:HD domain-containing protein [Paraburkholderia susongensis]|nr:HD domain-containing protein [Paraburkholderia susongensis]
MKSHPNETSAVEHFARSFAPHEQLVESLLQTRAFDHFGTDGSHDIGHIVRVWNLVSRIAEHEPVVDKELLAAATLLHDCVNIEKNDPRRSQASVLSAELASELLLQIGWTPMRIAATAHAIQSHSFSAGIEPQTLEAFILRDADRLDALGAIGIARTFYVAGRLGRSLYCAKDPLARDRELNDNVFALDHFRTKLLMLGDGLRTQTARQIAAERLELMRRFVSDFTSEASPSL